MDLVEQNPKFLEVAKISLENYSSRIGQYYPIGIINIIDLRDFDITQEIQMHPLFKAYKTFVL